MGKQKLNKIESVTAIFWLRVIGFIVGILHLFIRPLHWCIGKADEYLDTSKRIIRLYRTNHTNYSSIGSNFAKHVKVMYYEIDFRVPKFVIVSDTVCEKLGYTREELLAKNPYEILTPESRELFANRVKSFMQKKPIPDTIEYTAYRKDGSIIYGLLTTFFTFETDGRPKGAYVFAQDISQSKLDDLKKDEFLGLTAHELKNPIASMKAYIQMLIKKLETGDMDAKQAVDFLRSMDAKTILMTQIINDLLDVTRIRAGKIEYYDDIFDFNELVDSVVRDFRQICPTHKITVNCKCKGFIQADKSRITQVILNLLTNAVKYSPDAKKVMLHVNGGNKEVYLQVKDYGIGIAKDEQKDIFSAYYRSSDESRKGRRILGLGLGLFLCSEIIKHYKGKIWCESELGKGSVFHVTIPRKNHFIHS